MANFTLIRVRPSSGPGGVLTVAFTQALPPPPAPAAPAPPRDPAATTPPPSPPAPLLSQPLAFSIRQAGRVPSKTEQRGVNPLLKAFTYYYNQGLFRVVSASLAPTEGTRDGQSYVEGAGLIETSGNPPPEALFFQLSDKGELLVSGELAPKFSLRDGNLYYTN